MEINLKNLDEKELSGLFEKLDTLRCSLEKIKDTYVNGVLSENYLTDSELSSLLKVSRRCLNEYRNKGVLPYYKICGKILYKESEIEQLLTEAYKAAFKIKR